MRLAVISDIHANMDALQQVMADIDNSGIDNIVCLGDMVGYGPDPESVVKHIRARNIPAVMGNHELAIANPKILESFNPLARISIQKTIQLLKKPSIQYLCGLKAFMVFNGCHVVHGFPPDSVSTYLFQISKAELLGTVKRMTESLCFVGHTHTIEAVEYNGQDISRRPLFQGITQLQRDHRYIINAGSVGQPRDDTNDAKYVVWDTIQHQIEVRYIPYDIGAVVNKILGAGLPEAHANRLW